MSLHLSFRPLTRETWREFEQLFGEKGACGGCWCMYWRLNRPNFESGKGAGNRAAMKRLASSRNSPGLLAYADEKPVGWCAVAPREEYVRLERSRILQRLDDAPVWSVVCLFVAKPYRGRGVSAALLKAASEFARERGCRLLEGYPVEPKQSRVPDVVAWTGVRSAFKKAGFEEAGRRSLASR